MQEKEITRKPSMIRQMLRFSLMTLLALATLLAAFVAPIVARHRHVQRWHSLDKQDKSICLEWASVYVGGPLEGERFYFESNSLASKTRFVDLLSWCDNDFAKDCFRSVKVASVFQAASPAFRRNVGRQLGNSPNLVKLVWEGEYDSLTAANFGRLDNLSLIHFSNCEIEAASRHLSSCPNLQALILDNCEISEQGIQSLGKLAQLRLLLVNQSGLSDEQIVGLRQNLPGCYVYDATEPKL